MSGRVCLSVLAWIALELAVLAAIVAGVLALTPAGDWVHLIVKGAFAS